MIIGSYDKLTIGERRVGVIDYDFQSHRNQPYVVLRQATADEWLARLRDSDREAYREVATDPAHYFYEISLD